KIMPRGADAPQAVRAFANGTTHLVLGGTFTDLPYAQSVRLKRNSLRFDPAAGLFGLIPASRPGPFDELDVRRLLSQAIDRDALLAVLNVPGLIARATVLGPGLDGIPSPVQPAWFSAPLADRRSQLISE